MACCVAQQNGGMGAFFPGWTPLDQEAVMTVINNSLDACYSSWAGNRTQEVSKGFEMQPSRAPHQKIPTWPPHRLQSRHRCSMIWIHRPWMSSRTRQARTRPHWPTFQPPQVIWEQECQGRPYGTVVNAGNHC